MTFPMKHSCFCSALPEFAAAQWASKRGSHGNKVGLPPITEVLYTGKLVTHPNDEKGEGGVSKSCMENPPTWIDGNSYFRNPGRERFEAIGVLKSALSSRWTSPKQKLGSIDQIGIRDNRRIGQIGRHGRHVVAAQERPSPNTGVWDCSRPIVTGAVISENNIEVPKVWINGFVVWKKATLKGFDQANRDSFWYCTPFVEGEAPALLIKLLCCFHLSAHVALLLHSPPPWVISLWISTEHFWGYEPTASQMIHFVDPVDDAPK